MTVLYVLCNDVTKNWGFPIMSLGKSHPAILDEQFTIIISTQPTHKAWPHLLTTCQS